MSTENKKQDKQTAHKKRKYDTSFYSIRRAHPKDLPQIIDLIIAEPYFRWKELLQLMFSNIYVTVTWFVGALLVMAFAVGYLAVAKYNQYTSRTFYIALAIFTGVLIFSLCFMKAFSLYFVRYVRAFEIQSVLRKMDKNTLNDNAAILKNNQIHLFWKLYNFYVAEPYDQASKQLFLGVISLTSYTDYCKEKQIEDKDFELIVKAVPDGFKLISHKTIVVSYLIVNEKFFKSGSDETGKDNDTLRDCIYHGLLQYVEKKVIQDTSINYVIAESDDFVCWQHDILMHNKYGFCGERVDLIWDFYYQVTQDGFPNNKYFFIKVCNIDGEVFKKALETEQQKKKQLKENENVQQNKLI